MGGVRGFVFWIYFRGRENAGWLERISCQALRLHSQFYFQSSDSERHMRKFPSPQSEVKSEISSDRMDDKSLNSETFPCQSINSLIRKSLFYFQNLSCSHPSNNELVKSTSPSFFPSNSNWELSSFLNQGEENSKSDVPFWIPKSCPSYSSSPSLSL